MNPIYSIQFLKLIFFTSVSVPMIATAMHKMHCFKGAVIYISMVDLIQNLKPAITLSYFTKMV